METKYAYIAGVVDGEGCIRIRKDCKKRYRSVAYTLEVSIAQNDLKMLLFVQEIFGGRIYKKSYYYDGFNRHEGWRLVLHCKMAYALLEKVKPYLVTKLEQAELAMSFQESIKRTGYNVLSEETLGRREVLFQKVKSLKSPAETEQEGRLTSVCDSPISYENMS